MVVGIAWIVECAEQCKRVDEERFLISLDGVNVAGTQKVCSPSSLSCRWVADGFRAFTATTLDAAEAVPHAAGRRDTSCVTARAEFDPCATIVHPDSG